MKQTSFDMRVKAPTESDINAILAELDEDNNGEIDKDEFVALIMMVFEKMLDNENDLIAAIQEQD